MKSAECASASSFLPFSLNLSLTLPPIALSVLAYSVGLRAALVALISLVVYSWIRARDATPPVPAPSPTVRSILDTLCEDAEDGPSCIRAMLDLAPLCIPAQRCRASQDCNDEDGCDTHRASASEREEAQRLAMGALVCHHPHDGAFPDDEVCASAFALLTILLQGDGDGEEGLNKMVNRMLLEPKELGPKRIVSALRASLRRQREGVDTGGERGERIAAELARRGCLLLGSAVGGVGVVGTTARKIADAVADAGALEYMLDGALWWPGHLAVSNWALWGVFTVLHDTRDGAKARFVRDVGGLGKIGKIMDAARKETRARGAVKNSELSDVVGAQRHGMAALYEVLRVAVGAGPETALEVIEAFRMGEAVEAVRDAIVMCSEMDEMRAMGEQILTALGEKGRIPPRAESE
eukprot:CAMPEP_0194277718 /NCGR_PEP_ID=MMETSP0169-20130528/9964_1 /TAXON_ID=218684 /ORGANISM="Corethron pennatum, Strain L29A3" /LENGTH=409 /DNA_ID=CAMNT_0039021749 /DNA_START=67 /DNA_END=1296 /DNA_ORIENTATION=-